VATIIHAVSAALMVDASAASAGVASVATASTMSAAFFAARYDGAPMEFPGVLSFLDVSRSATAPIASSVFAMF
jgi:hypothetical protein